MSAQAVRSIVRNAFPRQPVAKRHETGRGSQSAHRGQPQHSCLCGRISAARFHRSRRSSRVLRHALPRQRRVRRRCDANGAASLPDLFCLRRNALRAGLSIVFVRLVVQRQRVAGQRRTCFGAAELGPRRNSNHRSDMAAAPRLPSTGGRRGCNQAPAGPRRCAPVLCSGWDAVFLPGHSSTFRARPVRRRTTRRPTRLQGLADPVRRHLVELVLHQRPTFPSQPATDDARPADRPATKHLAAPPPQHRHTHPRVGGGGRTVGITTFSDLIGFVPPLDPDPDKAAAAVRTMLAGRR